MARRRLLDAFCCRGGATRGYQDAGFHVVGVDITDQPDYCGDEFVRADMPQPEHRPHRGRVAGMRHGQWFTGPYFAVYGAGGGKGTVEQWQAAMGIDWTADRRALAEAIPPAYTRLIGDHLSAHLDQHPVPADLVKAA